MSHGKPVSTRTLMEWVYGRPTKEWHRVNIKRHARMFGYRCVGQIPGRSLLWDFERLL
jgi:hypothetical protein